MIEQRGPNSWRVGFQTSVSEGRKWIRKTITFPAELSESEQRARAEIEEARLRVDYADGNIVEDNPITVREFAQIWIDEHVRPDCSADTLKNYLLCVYEADEQALFMRAFSSYTFSFSFVPRPIRVPRSCS